MKFILTAVCVFTLFFSRATHIRGGEITATQVASLTYEITLTMYFDYNAVESGITISSQFVSVNGQSVVANMIDSTLINSRFFPILKCEYQFQYTFPSPNVLYNVSFNELFRSDGIINIQNSLEVPFYTELMLFVGNSLNSLNGTPVPKSSPMDIASVGQSFTHNLACWDKEGDSLSYKLVLPKKSTNEVVSNYQFPDDESFGSGVSLTLNSMSGQLEWDNPQKTGIYTVAIEVSEWGKSNVGAYLKSKFVRDMQIFVFESDNKRPLVSVPNDTLIESGKELRQQFKIQDLNSDSFETTTMSGLFELGASLELVDADSGLYQLVWTPTCEQTRTEPYYNVIYVKDDNFLSLSSTDVFATTILPPSPKGFNVDTLGGKAVITWSEVECNYFIDTLLLYSIEVTNAQSSLRIFSSIEDLNFELKTQISPSLTFYEEDIKDKTASYCYYLQSKDLNGVLSAKSDILCTKEIFFTGVKNASLKQQLDFYPNPVSDFIHFDQNVTLEIFKYKVINNYGVIVKEGVLSEKMDFSTLKSGVYIIEVTNSKTLEKFMFSKI